MFEFEKYNKRTALMMQGEDKILYEEIDAFCRDLGTKIIPHSLMMIKSSICVGTIMGYVAAVKNRVAVIMCGEKEIEAEMAIGMYKPQYIWQKAEDMCPDGYKTSIGAYGYTLYIRIKIEAYKVNEKLALLLSTSGSTGSRKFVRISYDNLEINTASIIDSLNIKEEDRAMVMLPISYTYGLSVINTYLDCGAVLLVPKTQFISSSFWKFAEDSGCSAVCGVPYTYEVIKRLNIPAWKMPSLKLVTQAGGKLSDEMERYISDCSRKYDFRFAVMYGQTEATARMACHFPCETGNTGSAGKAIRGGKFKIVNGEIVYCGGNVSMGYAYSYKDLVKEDDNHGILYTGDMGYIKDEYLYVTGRKNRVAKINGHRINLDELSELTKRITKCDNVCVENKGKILVVFEENNDSKNTEEVSYVLGSYTGISRSMFCRKTVAKIPRKDNGKIDYTEIINEVMC